MRLKFSITTVSDSRHFVRFGFHFRNRKAFRRPPRESAGSSPRPYRPSSPARLRIGPLLRALGHDSRHNRRSGPGEKRAGSACAGGHAPRTSLTSRLLPRKDFRALQRAALAKEFCFATKNSFTQREDRCKRRKRSLKRWNRTACRRGLASSPGKILLGERNRRCTLPSQGDFRWVEGCLRKARMLQLVSKPYFTQISPRRFTAAITDEGARAVRFLARRPTAAR